MYFTKGVICPFESSNGFKADQKKCAASGFFRRRHVGCGPGWVFQPGGKKGYFIKLIFLMAENSPERS